MLQGPMGRSSSLQHFSEGWCIAVFPEIPPAGKKQPPKRKERSLTVCPGCDQPRCHTTAKLSSWAFPGQKGKLQARGWLSIGSHTAWEQPFFGFFTIFLSIFFPFPSPEGGRLP